MNHATPRATINHEKHQQLAYQLWERAGCPTGNDIDFWLLAEQQLTALYGTRQVPLTRKNSTTPKAASRPQTKPRNAPSKPEPGNARSRKKLGKSA